MPGLVQSQEEDDGPHAGFGFWGPAPGGFHNAHVDADLGDDAWAPELMAPGGPFLGLLGLEEGGEAFEDELMPALVVDDSDHHSDSSEPAELPMAGVHDEELPGLMDGFSSSEGEQDAGSDGGKGGGDDRGGDHGSISSDIRVEESLVGEPSDAPALHVANSEGFDEDVQRLWESASACSSDA
jgi:hypothetical protein